MNSIQRAESPAMAQENPTLTYWPTLDAEEQAFVVAYVENTFNLSDASDALALPKGHLQKLLCRLPVKKAIAEMQEAMGDIDFLNEKWVKAQLLRIFPMVMGDESVPMIDSTGAQIMGRKFVPDVAMKVLEYVAPKKQAAVQIDIHNTIDLRSAIEEGNARRKARIESGLTITVEKEDE